MATNWKQRALDAEAALANRPAELDQAIADRDAARDRANELHGELERSLRTQGAHRVTSMAFESALVDHPDNVEALCDILDPPHTNGRQYRNGSELHVKLQAKARAILAHLRARAGA